MCLVLKRGGSEELQESCCYRDSPYLQKLAVIMRPGTLQQVADSSAAAYLSKEPLGPADSHMLQQLYPDLYGFSLQIFPHDTQLDSRTAELQQAVPLYVRKYVGQAIGTACQVAILLPTRPGLPAGLCSFEFVGTESPQRYQQELQEFAWRVQDSLVHQSKVAIEEAWYQLTSSVPQEVAISLMRDSCKGFPVLEEGQMKAALHRATSAPTPPRTPSCGASCDAFWAEEVDVLLAEGGCPEHTL